MLASQEAVTRSVDIKSVSTERLGTRLIAHYQTNLALVFKNIGLQ